MPMSETTKMDASLLMEKEDIPEIGLLKSHELFWSFFKYGGNVLALEPTKFL